VAKVVGPLHALWARDSFGEAMVLLSWKGQDRIRVWAYPYQPRTPAQKAIRTRFWGAVKSWHEQTAYMKWLWNEYAKKISTAYSPLSGFNAYVRAYIKKSDHPGTPTEWIDGMKSPYEWGG